MSGDIALLVHVFKPDPLPQFATTHRNLAQAFEEKGERLLAAQAYDRYLLLAPGAADAAEVRTKIAQLRGGENP